MDENDKTQFLKIQYTKYIVDFQYANKHIAKLKYIALEKHKREKHYYFYASSLSKLRNHK